MTEMELPSKRKAGRPKGSFAPVLADLSDTVTVEDFAFVRSIVQKMKAKWAFKKYFQSRHFPGMMDGEVPHGHTVQAHVRDLMQRILSRALKSGDDEIAAMAGILDGVPIVVVNEADDPQEDANESTPPATIDRSVPSMEEWIETESIDLDFYKESELIEEYISFIGKLRAANNKPPVTVSEETRKKETERINRAVSALNHLQTRLASVPHGYQPIKTWLSRDVCDRLEPLRVKTLGELVQFIGLEGRHWRRKLKGFGPVRSGRLMEWLQANSETIGVIDQSGDQWMPAKRLKSAIPRLMEPDHQGTLVAAQAGVMVAPPRDFASTPRRGVAPLELMQVPQEIDGRDGLYRGPANNHWGVHTDLQAIRVWLATYLHGGRTATFDAYRREIERFYLWCLHQARIPLSSVSLGHALTYQRFLDNIPAQYIGTARVTREDPRWRPWRGQLDPKSKRYALSVVGQFFKAAHANGYLAGNPFSSVKSSTTDSRDLDTSRSLNEADLAWLHAELQDHLKANPGRTADGGFDLDEALRRRLNLVFYLALSTGLRLSELASTTTGTMRPALIKGSEDESFWMLEVLGKGRKIRTVPIPDTLRQMIFEHHEDVRAMLSGAGQGSAWRLAEFEKRPPLVCALQAPVGFQSKPVNDVAPMANKNLALSEGGLYKILKRFFTQRTKAPIKALDKRLLRISEQLEKLEQTPSAEATAFVRKEIDRLLRERKVWLRRASMTTHWLRHSFAHGILRDNPNDAGLKLAQQLMGHASIATTQIYLKMDDTDKTRAILNLKPFGAAATMR